MADAGFENRLLRMFDEPPPLGDSDLFAERVVARLDRGWGLRQVLIGAFGFVGGLIGAVQMMGSGLAPELERASEQSSQVLTSRVESLWRSSEALSAMPLSNEVVWMAAALGVMALAFAITRAVEEL
ncbi:MAG TPA: hypothetical protein VF138_08270 [Caulobacteraceae bacterium]